MRDQVCRSEIRYLPSLDQLPDRKSLIVVLHVDSKPGYISSEYGIHGPFRNDGQFVSQANARYPIVAVWRQRLQIGRSEREIKSDLRSPCNPCETALHLAQGCINQTFSTTDVCHCACFEDGLLSGIHARVTQLVTLTSMEVLKALLSGFRDLTG